ncbi:hypothetical protein QUB75_20470 [Microcoleus sp. K1-B6]
MIANNSVWLVVSSEVLSTNAPQAPQVLQTVKICSGISTAYRSNLRVAIPSACTALSNLIELNFSYLKRVEVYFLACRVELTSCTILKNRQDACSTKDKFSCGTGILPVQKRLIENGARCEAQRSGGSRLSQNKLPIPRSPKVL